MSPAIIFYVFLTLRLKPFVSGQPDFIEIVSVYSSSDEESSQSVNEQSSQRSHSILRHYLEKRSNVFRQIMDPISEDSDPHQTRASFDDGTKVLFSNYEQAGPSDARQTQNHDKNIGRKRPVNKSNDNEFEKKIKFNENQIESYPPLFLEIQAKSFQTVLPNNIESKAKEPDSNKEKDVETALLLELPLIDGLHFLDAHELEQYFDAHQIEQFLDAHEIQAQQQWNAQNYAKKSSAPTAEDYIDYQDASKQSGVQEYVVNQDASKPSSIIKFTGYQGGSRRDSVIKYVGCQKGSKQSTVKVYAGYQDPPMQSIGSEYVGNDGSVHYCEFGDGPIVNPSSFRPHYFSMLNTFEDNPVAGSSNDYQTNLQWHGGEHF